MPNPLYNNMHGGNRSQGEGASNKSKGSAPGGGMSMKTANWPGVPGPTQRKDRSAGVKKSGSLGAFTVKAEGL